MADTLLIIEDEDLLGRELKRHFQRIGWEVLHSRSLSDARRVLLDERIDPLVVLADMSLPDGNSLDMLESVREETGGGEWVLLTGFGTVPDSVRALRLGAYDFLEKPTSLERLDLVVAGAARSSRAQRRLREEAAQRNQRYTPDALVGSSASTREVRKMIERLATVPLSALIIAGETGTGKGLVARILHYSGPRAEGPLIEVNCAALPSELLESELFGHEAGAFTGARGRHRGLIEQATGGTLFLDEIGDLSLPLQAKLLKAIEDQRVRHLGGEKEIEVDVQFFAASNRDLASLVREGTMREDLYHRLNLFRIDLAPLRERMEDMEELAATFVAEFSARAGKRVITVPESVWARLRGYSWPGNVRELRNVIERGVLLAESEVFPERWLQLPEPGQPPTPRDRSDIDGDIIGLPIDGSLSLDEMESTIIQRALERAHYNVAATARLLGTTRQTLRYRIEKHGLNERVAEHRSHED